MSYSDSNNTIVFSQGTKEAKIGYNIDVHQGKNKEKTKKKNKVALDFCHIPYISLIWPKSSLVSVAIDQNWGTIIALPMSHWK